MGQQYILQPDGKWAIYSRGMDSLDGIDFTEEELIEFVGLDAKLQAEENCRNHLKLIREGKRKTQFTVTWEEAVKQTKKNCDDAEFVKSIEEIKGDAICCVNLPLPSVPNS